MRLLVSGVSGFLGHFLVDELLKRKHEIIGLAGERKAAEGCLQTFACDLAEELPTKVKYVRYDGVIHCAAISGVMASHLHPERSRAVNVGGTKRLARLAKARDIPFVYVSSDVIFDGMDVPPGGYSATSPPNPLNVYAQTKVEAEKISKELVPHCAIVRPSLLYRRAGEGEIAAGVEWVISKVKAGEDVTIYTDQIRHPTYVRALAELLAELVERKGRGVFHAGSPKPYPRDEFTRLLLKNFGLSPDSVKTGTVAQTPPKEGLRVPLDLTFDTKMVTEFLGHHFADPAHVLAV